MSLLSWGSDCICSRKPKYMTDHLTKAKSQATVDLGGHAVMKARGLLQRVMEFPVHKPVVVPLGDSSSEDEGQNTDGAPVSGLDIDSFLKAQRKTVEVKWWLQGLCGGATCHSESECRFGVRVAVPGVQTVYIYIDEKQKLELFTWKRLLPETKV